MRGYLHCASSLTPNQSDRAWIGGFLELGDERRGPWFSLEVARTWALWAFATGDPEKVIAALELLATLLGYVSGSLSSRIERPRELPSEATRITGPTKRVLRISKL